MCGFRRLVLGVLGGSEGLIRRTDRAVTTKESPVESGSDAISRVVARYPSSFLYLTDAPEQALLRLLPVERRSATAVNEDLMLVIEIVHETRSTGEAAGDSGLISDLLTETRIDNGGVVVSGPLDTIVVRVIPRTTVLLSQCIFLGCFGQPGLPQQIFDRHSTNFGIEYSFPRFADE